MVEFFEYQGVLWRKENFVIEPVDIEPIEWDCERSAKLLQPQHEALMLRWVKAIDTEPTEMWFVVQSEFLPLQELSANTRSKVRRGFKHFEYSIESPEVIATQGYDVYKATHGSRLSRVMDPQQFYHRIMSLPQGYQLVGIWHSQSGKLVGYAQLYVNERFVQMRVIRITSKAKRQYAAYGFFYWVSQYYVKTARKTLVLGLRTFTHRSEVQDFVIKKFGYKPMYAKLGVCLSSLGKTLYRLFYRLRGPLNLLPVKQAKYLAAFLDFVTLAQKQNSLK